MQIITLFTPETSQPCHIRRPTSKVEMIVSRQEM
jgi:hypothetical protein